VATGFPAPRPGQTSADFVGELGRLKAWAGLSYRDLERLVKARGRGLAPSTLATALSRASLPQPNLVAAFVAAFGGTEADVAKWVDVRRAVAQEVGGRQHRVRGRPRRPG